MIVICNCETLPNVVGATFMAPVVGMDHVGGIDYPHDGRDQSGPYDNGCVQEL
jgi:hypothetical protein